MTGIVHASGSVFALLAAAIDGILWIFSGLATAALDAVKFVSGARLANEQPWLVEVLDDVVGALQLSISWGVSILDWLILQPGPDAWRYLALMSSGTLIAFVIGYIGCTLSVPTLASDIEAVGEWHKRLLASLPTNVENALTALSHEPYIVCRKACHSWIIAPWLFFFWRPVRLDLRNRVPGKWGGPFLQMNHAIAIATMRALGVRIRRYDGEKFFADVTTDRLQQKTVANDHDQFDLELRFVQDEPQRPFSKGDLSKPKYAIFQCLFNPINDPIWVLPLADVMHRLAEVCSRPENGLSFATAVETLSSASFPIFRRVERDANAGVRVKAAEDPLSPILMVTKDPDGTPRYRSGYDENNISYATLPATPAVRKALFVFQKAMEEAAEKDSVQIDLQRGDMLLVRNQEAFYCRREMDDHWFSAFTVLPRARWLRRYMAFDSPPSQSASGSTSGRERVSGFDARTLLNWGIFSGKAACQREGEWEIGRDQAQTIDESTK